MAPSLRASESPSEYSKRERKAIVLLTLAFIVLSTIAHFALGALYRPGRLYQIEVDVAASAAVSIDGAPTSAARLYRALAAAVRAHTHRTGFTRHVALIAANAAPYAVIIRILDAARQAGDDDVGFVTY